MSVEDAFAPIEAAYRNEILVHTFGHLAATPHKKYPTKVWMVEGDYTRGPVVLKCRTEVEDSPWFYEHLHAFIYEMWKAKNPDVGSVLLFDGCYITNKAGEARWVGKTTTVFIPRG